MTNLSRLLREPLLHFFLIGSAIFGIYAATATPGPPPVDMISIGPERIEQLRSGFESVWRRPPTEAELAGLTEDFVRGEIYYREALALGLDRNDTVIRQRLRQKMEFLTDAGTNLREPTDAELAVWFAANPDLYREEPQLALQQVFLGTGPAPEVIARLLAALRDVPEADFAAMGQRTLLPRRLDLSGPHGVDGVFGSGFFGLLVAMPERVWSGPVASSYGLHLVRIVDRRPGRLPALDEVRKAVSRDREAARAAEARAAAFGRLRKGYVVEIDGAPVPDIARR